MRRVFVLIFLALAPLSAAAQDASDIGQSPAEQGVLRSDAKDLSEFVWINRPIVVLADSPQDPRFIQQMKFIEAELDELAERDVVVLTDTDPSANSALREALHPRGFMLVLIGKDGMIKLRKPVPWDVREISRVIDKMPMRQQEIRDRRGIN
ncbi:DUF4174 domain-containing protein [Roseovarius faecimaris]|uniref:DUF4174 domain-containing protein n=1 Tax=Roseovarius faecimaris TaxID=2494550 RepID=A0A6I6IMH4_9RHOB|nr:DUF4174 domain-containing protein [Roseovarius faecimaris]QGX97795.1 DUF4174 domain-containing protein [Roseovarius faecimaris]